MCLSHPVLFHGSNMERQESSSREGKHVFSGLGATYGSILSTDEWSCFNWGMWNLLNMLAETLRPIYNRLSFTCKAKRVDLTTQTQQQSVAFGKNVGLGLQWTPQILLPVCHPGPRWSDLAPLSWCCHLAACDIRHVCLSHRAYTKKKNFILGKKLV